MKPNAYKNTRSTKPASSSKREKYQNGVPQSFSDRNLAGISPNQQQFEPTPQEAVRQHYKMAGGC